MAADVPVVALRDGNLIPQLGFGTWQIPTADCPRVIGEAIRIGYRSFDTAQAYGNEDGLGQAIRDSGLARGDVFITSKLRNSAHRRDTALRSFDETMRKLGIDQLDLFLIHWPVPAEDYRPRRPMGLPLGSASTQTRACGATWRGALRSVAPAASRVARAASRSSTSA